MVTSARWKWFLPPIVGIALLAGGLVVHVEGGKPKPPPPPPPVLYNIQLWTAPDGGPVDQFNKMNNLGQIVGWYYNEDVYTSGEKRAFLYNPVDESGNPATAAIDLNTIATAPVVNGTQMVIASAAAINDNGLVVGYLQPEGSPYSADFRKAFVLDTTALQPTVVVLPEPDSAYAYNFSINNMGDILETYIPPDGPNGVCVYTWDAGNSEYVLQYDLGTEGYGWAALNNWTQVALRRSDGLPYRWTPPGTFELIDGTKYATVGGINDWGMVCGRTYAKPPTGREYGYPYRWNGSGSLEVLFGVPAGVPEPAAAINFDSDLLVPSWVNRHTKIYVYQNSKASFFDVESLIDPTDPESTIWCNTGKKTADDMNDRIGTTGFGQIGGMISVNDIWMGYLLTPRPPQ